MKALRSIVEVVSTMGCEVGYSLKLTSVVVSIFVTSVVVSIGVGLTNSWVKSIFVPVVVVSTNSFPVVTILVSNVWASVVNAFVSIVEVVSTIGVEAVKSMLLTSKVVPVVSTIGSVGVNVVDSILFKAEVAPTIDSVFVKSKLLVSTIGVEVVISPKLILGSTDCNISVLNSAPVSTIFSVDVVAKASKFSKLVVPSKIWALSGVSIIGEDDS